MGVDQIAKIAIFGDEHAPLGESAVEDVFVGGAGLNLGNCEDVVTGFAKSVDHRTGAALIGQEIHRLGVRCWRRAWEEDHFFMGYASGTVRDGGADIFGGEVRIVLEEVGFGGALGEFAQE